MTGVPDRGATPLEPGLYWLRYLSHRGGAPVERHEPARWTGIAWFVIGEATGYLPAHRDIIEAGDRIDPPGDGTADAAGLREAVTEFLAAEAAVDAEAERAKQPGANAWSVAPVIRRMEAVGALRKAVGQPASPAAADGCGPGCPFCDDPTIAGGGAP
jgi:hypothetical protein